MQQYLKGSCEGRMETQAAKLAEISNREFISGLRRCVTAYFDAIDTWETQFRKYNRLTGTHYRVPDDLQDAQRKYVQARLAIEPVLPRARQLCRRFEIYDPWPWTLKIQLGSEAALGANERRLILRCLRELEFRIDDTELAPEMKLRREQTAMPARSLWRRILDYIL